MKDTLKKYVLVWFRLCCHTNLVMKENRLKLILVSNFKDFFSSQQFEKFQENHEYKMKQAELQVLETRNQKENAELSLKSEIQSWQKKLYEEEEARQKVYFITLQLFTNLL